MTNDNRLAPHRDQDLSHRGDRSGPVPYITRWSAERHPPLRMVEKRGGIGYAGEKPYDRDTQGVLWSRTPSLPGKGRPQFGQVHALRQHRAMTELRCQVCGGPADRDADGVLWLLGEDPHDRVSWPPEILTVHPPLCRPCAAVSVRVCPHLRAGCVALRVRAVRPVGVRGALYRPGASEPVPIGAVGVAYDDPRIHWVRAGQLIVQLTHVDVVDPASLG
ncbi:hypothetical protein [Streptomyces catenulae]|uniref:Phage protein n=1 Tax=Streptomyces catenulae TaxID=66875 RepID=A0ABV2YTR3_9ACTN|nr:hypothetical protein [Streptomyces catenulae]